MPKADIKVLLADNHPVILKGLSTMLEEVEGFDVVAEANNSQEILLKLNTSRVDIIIINIQMAGADGTDAVTLIRRLYPTVRILALAMHVEWTFLEKLVYLRIEASVLNPQKEELEHALRQIYGGAGYFSPEIQQILADRYSEIEGPDLQGTLTKRELQVLKLIVLEYKSPAIAEALFLSPETIKTHRRNLLRKLKVSNTAGLVKFALHHEMVE